MTSASDIMRFRSRLGASGVDGSAFLAIYGSNSLQKSFAIQKKSITLLPVIMVYHNALQGLKSAPLSVITICGHFLNNMKKKKIMLPCIAAVAIATFVAAKSFQTNASESANLLLAYVEALSQDETYFKVKERNSNSCTIHVGAKGKIKLLGGTILTADANGDITFDGEIVCSGMGDVYCKPVECVDLYQILK